MDNIKKNISDNQFKQIYLIFGEEEFVKRGLKKMLAGAIVPPDDTMNFNRYEGKGISVPEVIGLCETLPFFADRRLILLENTGFFKSANEELLTYLAAVPESSYLIFCEEEVDKRSKMYKFVKTAGYACECKRLSSDDIMKWILGRIGKEQKKIQRTTMNYLLEVLGNDMDKISQEIEKLLCYTMGREVITIEDVDAICSQEITGKIFEMIDAMGNKQKEKALRLYYDLLIAREPPMRILYLLSRQFNIMLQVQELAQGRTAPKEIAAKLGIQAFIVNKTLAQVKKFSPSEIKYALEQSASIEESVKLGKLNDKIAVEMILLDFSS